jgi:hypothetical protein
MERTPMNVPDLSTANDPDLRASFAALQRAANIARQTTIQTETNLVVVQEGQLVHLPASKLSQPYIKPEPPHLGSALAELGRRAGLTDDDIAAPFDPRRFYGSAHQSRQEVDHYLASSRHCAENNPLKGSVTFEKDIVSPLDLDWDAAQ